MTVLAPGVRRQKVDVTERAFLDTNILLYSLSPIFAEREKQRIAEQLLNRANCALSMQVLHEFYHQATHARREHAISSQDAWELIKSWQRFDIQENTFPVLEAAHALKARTGYSIWDCLILAAALAQGCKLVYSEDMQHGRIIDGLRIINPFEAGAIPS